MGAMSQRVRRQQASSPASGSSSPIIRRDSARIPTAVFERINARRSASLDIVSNFPTPPLNVNSSPRNARQSPYLSGAKFATSSSESIESFDSMPLHAFPITASPRASASSSSSSGLTTSPGSLSKALRLRTGSATYSFLLPERRPAPVVALPPPPRLTKIEPEGREIVHYPIGQRTYSPENYLESPVTPTARMEKTSDGTGLKTRARVPSRRRAKTLPLDLPSHLELDDTDVDGADMSAFSLTFPRPPSRSAEPASSPRPTTPRYTQEEEESYFSTRQPSTRSKTVHFTAVRVPPPPPSSFKPSSILKRPNPRPTISTLNLKQSTMPSQSVLGASFLTLESPPSSPPPTGGMYRDHAGRADSLIAMMDGRKRVGAV